MVDDADVLRFRRRERDEPAWPDEDDRYVDVLESDIEPTWQDRERGRRPGELTQVVLIGDQIVDVVRRPVSGSGYECAALELEDRGRGRAEAPPAPPEPPGHERQLVWLARIVGGDEVLMALDTEPLRLAPLDVDAVPERLHQRVRGVGERLDAWVPPLLGEEALAAARLVLTRSVAAEPALLTRSDRDDTAAGAVIYAVAKGNDLSGPGRPVRTSVLQSVCGLRSTPTDRARSFVHAVSGGSTTRGWGAWLYSGQPEVLPLGSPDLLLARFRRDLVRTRDHALELRSRTPVRPTPSPMS